MSLTICKITGLPVADLTENGEHVFYTVDFHGKEIRFNFCHNCYYKKEIEENKHIILSLFLNDKVYLSGKNRRIHWDSDEKDVVELKVLVAQGVYPRTPKEKLDNLFKELYELQEYDGEVVQVLKFINEEYARLYFKNKEEMKHYLMALSKQGDIDIEYNSENGVIRKFNFTYQGLNNYMSLFNEGFNSKNCFIAMAFDDKPDTIETRKAIKEAVEETGFVPVLVDEKNIDSDKTINDEIIHLLRGCKFCIADFTQQKKGVYFESGFAVGQGKPVIYTCEEKDFANAHFDIKPLQHIIYKTPLELKEALIHKIKAWIK